MPRLRHAHMAYRLRGMPLSKPVITEFNDGHTYIRFTNTGKVNHDDVIKWKHFPRYWPFVRGIHRSPVNYPHKGQWRGALMFSLNCAWTNGWENNRDANDLRRHRAYYDVTVILITHAGSHFCTRAIHFQTDLIQRWPTNCRYFCHCSQQVLDLFVRSITS